jgi:hypothetical protein
MRLLPSEYYHLRLALTSERVTYPENILLKNSKSILSVLFLIFALIDLCLDSCFRRNDGRLCFLVIPAEAGIQEGAKLRCQLSLQDVNGGTLGRYLSRKYTSRGNGFPRPPRTARQAGSLGGRRAGEQPRRTGDEKSIRK